MNITTRVAIIDGKDTKLVISSIYLHVKLSRPYLLHLSKSICYFVAL
jgi:hypothetical protein